MAQRSRCAQLRSFKHAKIRTFKVFALFILLSFELLNPLNLEPLFAQANFYQGKTIRIIVGNLPGDTHDLFARAYSRSMGKHISGNSVDAWCRTCPARARMIAANHVYDGCQTRRPDPGVNFAGALLRAGDRQQRSQIRLAEVYLDRLTGAQRLICSSCAPTRRTRL